MANSTVCQSNWKPTDEPRRAKQKTYRQVPIHLRSEEKIATDEPPLNG